MQKKFHLKDNDDFKRLIQAKQFVSKGSLTVYFQKNKLNYSRFGISVGKKHGNAPTRNKIKRQLRMMIASIFDFSDGYDYVIMIRPQYKDNTYQENLLIMEQLSKLIKKRCAK